MFILRELSKDIRINKKAFYLLSIFEIFFEKKFQKKTINLWFNTEVILNVFEIEIRKT